MPDDDRFDPEKLDPTAPLLDQIHSQEELEAFYRHVAAEVAAKAASTPPTATVPAPTATTPADDARQAALDALARQAEDKRVAEGARLLLKQRMAAAGYTNDLEHITDDEVLEAVGIKTKTLTGDDARIAEENAIYADPSKLATYDRQRELDAYRRRFWQISKGERIQQARELGIDLDQYDPPETLGGLR